MFKINSRIHLEFFVFFTFFQLNIPPLPPPPLYRDTQIEALH